MPKEDRKKTLPSKILLSSQNAGEIRTCWKIKYKKICHQQICTSGNDFLLIDILPDRN